MLEKVYPGKRIQAGLGENHLEHLANEEPMHITLNGDAYVLTMRTADGHDEALTRGLLFTEGIITDPKAPLRFAEIMDPDTKHLALLDVTVPPEFIQISIRGRRSQASTSSCGICGTRDPAVLDLYGDPVKITREVHVTSMHILAMVASMQQEQQTFAHTGGTHGAGAYWADGTQLVVREDIGRHNAVDKVIGELLVSGRLDDAVVLTVSGRISYEIVSKVYRSQIPILVAVSAPSSMAVETAEAFGITLVGFCREDRLTVYTHPERIDVDKEAQ